VHEDDPPTLYRSSRIRRIPINTADACHDLTDRSQQVEQCGMSSAYGQLGSPPDAAASRTGLHKSRGLAASTGDGGGELPPRSRWARCALPHAAA